MNFTRLPTNYFQKFTEIIHNRYIDFNFNVFENKIQEELHSHYYYYYRRLFKYENEKYFTSYMINLDLLSPNLDYIFNYEQEIFPKLKTHLQFSLFPNLYLANNTIQKPDIILKGQNSKLQDKRFNYLTHTNILRINKYIQNSKIFKKENIHPILKESNKAKYFITYDELKGLEDFIWSISEQDWLTFKYYQNKIPEIIAELLILKNFLNECAKFKDCWILITV